MPERRSLVLVAVLVLALAAVPLALLALGGGNASGPDSPPQPPDASGAAVAPDLVPLEPDGAIDAAWLAHDSRRDLYRVPWGAVPAGTDVTLRLSASAGDLTTAVARVTDDLSGATVSVPLERVARDATAGEHGIDYWQATISTTAQPTVLRYRFIVSDGAATRYLEDDELLDGGAGEVLTATEERGWQITTYDPDFETPAWARGAVVYQVFPDRFANGDPANDPSPDAAAGTAGAERYRYGDVYGNPVLPRDWETDLPEGYCRAYAGAGSCGEEPLGRDFYGGDLAGLTEHLPQIAELGVTILYLNPIFAAPSNHRYDTSDYEVIDPDLGTRGEFDDLVAAAGELGMRVILDGVFNHTSSDSPSFDRAHRFEEVGACEAAGSPYATWYQLEPGPPAKCFDGRTYADWAGFDTLPALAETPDVFGAIFGPDGIAVDWLAAGIGGWRLDVMNEISHGVLRGLRDSVKAADPDALILGEFWEDASPWLLGTEADSVMNYRFRRAVIGLVNGQTPDLDGAIGGLTPSAFASVMEGVREDYPPQAWAVLHNLVDSHDTTRILWTLTPGADNRAEKEDPANLEVGVAKLRQLAALQLTWPGMAGIYYGDEAGLTGHDDPDDRRPYPWGHENLELRDWYAILGQLRADHPALRDGDLRILLADDDAGILAFGRRTGEEAAITVLNLADTDAADVRVDVEDWLPAGTPLVDALSGTRTEVGDGLVSVALDARGSAVLITDGPVDLEAPAAPESLAAEVSADGVALSWPSSPDAAGYIVWRSVVSGGGYRAVGGTEDTAFTDRGARDGTRWHYVVTAYDAVGNEGPRSPEAIALPEVTLVDATLAGPDAISQPLSAVEPGTPIEVVVRTDGPASDGATVGLLVELGVATADARADDAAAWTWTPTRYAGEAAGADRFSGAVRPEAAGTWQVLARVSTDGGTTWRLVDRAGLDATADPLSLTTVRGDDQEAPRTPDDLAATMISDSGVTLTWASVPDDDLYRYEILRGGDATDSGELVGTADEPAFTDTTTRSGATYHYRVVAVDTSFNRSEPSESLEVGAESREVQVTLRATVPPNTPPDAQVYIAGDFQNWDPGATPMKRVDATTWIITLPFEEGVEAQFKFTRGSWLAVEKGQGCEEIENRTFTAAYGADGTQLVEATIAKWRDLDACDG
jgi:glycosidase